MIIFVAFYLCIYDICVISVKNNSVFEWFLNGFLICSAKTRYSLGYIKMCHIRNTFFPVVSGNFDPL